MKTTFCEALRVVLLDLEGGGGGEVEIGGQIDCARPELLRIGVRGGGAAQKCRRWYLVWRCGGALALPADALFPSCQCGCKRGCGVGGARLGSRSMRGRHWPNEPLPT